MCRPGPAGMAMAPALSVSGLSIFKPVLFARLQRLSHGSWDKVEKHLLEYGLEL